MGHKSRGNEWVLQFDFGLNHIRSLTFSNSNSRILWMFPRGFLDILAVYVVASQFFIYWTGS